MQYKKYTKWQNKEEHIMVINNEKNAILQNKKGAIVVILQPS